MFPSPITHSHLSMGTCCYTTYQPHGPHLWMGHVFERALGAQHFMNSTIEKKLHQVPNPR
jgi:hypothetical protein